MVDDAIECAEGKAGIEYGDASGTVVKIRLLGKPCILSKFAASKGPEGKPGKPSGEADILKCIHGEIRGLDDADLEDTDNSSAVSEKLISGKKFM